MNCCSFYSFPGAGRSKETGEERHDSSIFSPRTASSTTDRTFYLMFGSGLMPNMLYVMARALVRSSDAKRDSAPARFRCWHRFCVLCSSVFSVRVDASCTFEVGIARPKVCTEAIGWTFELVKEETTIQKGQHNKYVTFTHVCLL